MKNLHFLILLLAMISSKGIFGQTISTNFTAVVPCCADTAFIDLNNDSIVDVEIRSNFFIDSGWFSAISLQSNIKLANPEDSGQAYTFYNNQATLSQTTLGCTWNSMWFPGSGEKYAGYYRVNAVNDTTFGWIKMDFRGTQNTCLDTIFVLEAAYNIDPNLHLNAGERLSSTSTNNLSSDFHINLYPNPANDRLFVLFNTEDLTSSTINIFNQFGELLLSKETDINSIELDISRLFSGIYFIETRNKYGKSVNKFIKI